MKAKLNSLKRPEMLRLFKWVESHKSELEQMHAPEASIAATNALGFHVSEWNIRSLCKDANVELKGRRLYRRSEPPSRTSKRISFLAGQLVALTRVVEELHEAWGTEFPSDRVNVDVLRQMRLGHAETDKPPAPEANGHQGGLFYDPEE